MLMNVLKVLGILSIISVVVALMMPSLTRGREAARRTQCKNNLKQILLALHNYESTYHAFPPAHTVDPNGNPLHSWRTLILPYLDHQKLYESIDLSKPWDDPVNAEAHKTIIQAFRCPSLVSEATPGDAANKTTYLAVVTPDSCLRATESQSLSQVSDAPGETLMVIEVTPEHAVHWMAPFDAGELKVLNFGENPKRPHIGGTHSAMADGTVRFLSSNLSMNTIRAIMTSAGGDPAGDF